MSGAEDVPHRPLRAVDADRPPQLIVETAHARSALLPEESSMPPLAQQPQDDGAILAEALTGHASLVGIALDRDRGTAVIHW